MKHILEIEVTGFTKDLGWGSKGEGPKMILKSSGFGNHVDDNTTTLVI